jgi:hypothetical protein
MTTRTNDPLDRLRAADPAADTAGAYADPAARRALAAILATDPAAPAPHRPLRPLRPRLPRLPRLALAGAVVAAGVAAYVVVAPTTPVTRPPRAEAATVPLLAFDPATRPARAVLLDLAAKAMGRPAPAAGRYDYVRTRGWYLDGTAGLHGYRADVDERSFWVAADGSGRIDDVRRPVAGGPPDTGPSGTFGAGGLTAPAPIPAERDALRTRLHADGSWDGAQWLDAVEGVWSQQVVEPASQAALLRALADLPGLTYRGEVADRAGRSGLAVTADTGRSGLRERYVLVLDAETGALLDAEVVALERADLPEDPPLTISYTLFLDAHRTDATTGP